MRYNRSRVMKMAHREFAATKHRPGVTWSSCMKLAWAVERKIVAGRERYQPEESLYALPQQHHHPAMGAGQFVEGLPVIVTGAARGNYEHSVAVVGA
jgi:hypothetical protein